ncbi:MAG TPA: DNA repair protein RecN [Pseudolysinimonas sp.]|nr:DNA repair protein RecN [Pseudolysinimonas sp.]
MIEEISIRDLGVIGEARLPLGPGFTALTGETGAGKTMVVTALGLLLGDRADPGAVRSGSNAAVVDGHWNVAEHGPVAERVRDAGGDLDSDGPGRGHLVLSRSVSNEGRSRAIVGGRSAPIGVLSEIGEHLVVVHGQSEQLRLKSSSAQRDALDSYAGSGFAVLLGDYREVFGRWQTRQGELDVLTTEREARVREAAELRQAMDDIEVVAPVRGEDAELAEQVERLTNREDLRQAASDAQEAVSSQLADDGTDAVSRIDAARRAIERVSAHDPALLPIADALAEASFALADVSSQLSSYLGSLDADSGRELEVLQERRAALAGLARRFGPTPDDVVDFLERGSSRLLELDGDSDRIDELTREVEADRARLDQLAAELTAARRDAGARLGEAVTAELSALAMPDARLVIEITERELGIHGRDAVTILLQPHAGAEPRPLAKGASGGELSRVMLAIEVVLAGTDPVPTFVFDEVDAGVGGASATEIGRRLARLAESAQVIVVTHLAQVAAFASNHLTVVKGTDGTVTASSVIQLAGEDREAEMARLLSGLPDSDSGLAHARELLAAAQSDSKSEIR